MLFAFSHNGPLSSIVPLYFLRVLNYRFQFAARPPLGAPMKSKDNACRRSGATSRRKTGERGNKNQKPNMAAVASPQGQQPPAQGLQKKKAVEEKFLNRLHDCLKLT